MAYSEATQRAKVAAGWKGGPFYKNPILHPAMSFVDAVQPEVKATEHHTGIMKQSIQDPWYSRKSNK